MLSLLRWWRELTIVTLLGVVALGYYTWPEPKVQIIEREKIVTKVRTVIKTVTTKPDGTTIVKEEETSKDIKTKSDKKDTVAGKPFPQYSVVLLTPLRAPERPEVILGAQLGNLPVEAFTSYDFDSKSIKLGLGVRF